MDEGTPEEEMQLLEIKIRQLALDYEKYFLGNRPTEPNMLRSEVQKTVLRFSNTRITNTALRFKFNNVNGRFQAFKRRWDLTLRQIDAGTYERHVFKADLHDRERGIGVGAGAEVPARVNAGKRSKAAGFGELFETYRDALMATGQDVSKISPAKLKAAIRKQEAAVKKKLGCDRVDFKVVVQDGKVRLKAAAG